MIWLMSFDMFYNKFIGGLFMDIRIINENDYGKVATLIADSIENSHFSQYYPRVTIEEIKESLNELGVAKRASWTHFYVVEENDEIIGCGAIGPYYGSEEESSLFSIFVASKYQGKGIGRKIIETLESDEYFLRAKRIEIPASMSAIPFYRKMGYEHKGGTLIYSDGHFSLEKFNKK